VCTAGAAGITVVAATSELLAAVSLIVVSGRGLVFISIVYVAD
jgi:hypothetical protein